MTRKSLAIGTFSFVLLGVLAAFLHLPWSSFRDFSTRGEPREAIVMQDIVNENDWIMPSGYGGVVPSKPPFTHWVAAVVSWLTGGSVTEASARTPSGIFSVLGVLVTALFVARERGAGAGLRAGFMLMLSIEWLRLSMVSRVDMTLAALIACGLIATYRYFHTQAVSAAVLAIVALGCATLTKGPVALCLPGLISAIYFLTERAGWRRTATTLGIIFIPAGAFALIWYAAAYALRREEFLEKFWYENVARFLSAQDDEPHKRSAVSLWTSFLVGLLPWSLFCIPYLRSWIQGIRTHGVRRPIPSFERFCAIAVVSFLVFFSIPEGKRSVYLLPCYPFAIALLEPLLQHAKGARVVISSIVALLFLTASLLWIPLLKPDVVLSWLPKERSREAFLFFRDIAISIFENPLLVLFLLSSLLLTLLVLLRTASSSRAIKGLMAGWYIVFLWGNIQLFPAFSNPLSSKPFADQVRAAIPPDTQLYSFDTEYYALSYYLGRTIRRLEIVRPEKGVVFIDYRDIEALREAFPEKTFQELFRSETPVTRPHERIVAMRVE